MNRHAMPSFQDFANYALLLADIHCRPGLWLGEPSLTALEHFLNGIRMAEDLHKIPDECRLSGFEFATFQEWANERYNPKRLAINTFEMARRMTSDEASGFYVWFGWCNSFNAESV